MKKKRIRFLSCLVTALFLCLLLPAGAMAANNQVPLKLTISSYGAPFIDGNTGQHSIYSVTWLEYINKSDVGSDNASGTARAYFTQENDIWWLTLDIEIGQLKKTVTHACNAKITNKDMSKAEGNISFGLSFNTSNGTSTYISISGAQSISEAYILNYDANGGHNAPDSQTGSSNTGSYTFTVSSTVPIHTDEALEFKGWSATKNGSTIYQGGDSYTVASNNNPATLYAVWGEKEQGGDNEPTPPAPPTSDNVIEALGSNAVKIFCGKVSEHSEKTYELEAGTFTIGSVTGNADTGYSISVTVNAANYVTKYGSSHELDDTSSKTLILNWNAEINCWTASNAPVSFKVKCKSVGETWTIKLRILEISDKYNLGYTIIPGETTRTVQNDTDVNQFNITVPSFDTVANELNYSVPTNHGFIGLTHDQSADKNSIINNSETMTDVPIDNVYVTSNGHIVWYVVKQIVPSVPPIDELYPILEDVQVKIDCINPNVIHNERTYSLLKDSLNPDTKVTEKNGSYFYKVDVRAEKYVDLYNQDYPAKHEISGESVKTIVLSYTNEEWVLDTATVPVEFTVECDETGVPPLPNLDDIEAEVKVVCINFNVDHPAKTYMLRKDSLKSDTKVTQNDNNSYSFKVTVLADPYVELYNQNYSEAHKISGASEKTIILDYINGCWVLNIDTLPVEFTVECNAKPVFPAMPPQTGDDSMLILWTLLALLSIAGFAIMNKHTSMRQY